MRFICGVNDLYVGKPGRRVSGEGCTEEFDTMEELLEHIRARHRKSISREILRDSTPSLERLRDGS